ncbi:MAG: hypothetical protein R3B84_13445 [Zavarzinella sp.]
MIEVIMFDLGGTLVSGSPPVPMPGILEALADIQTLVDSNGKPLDWCLVSDFYSVTPPAVPNKVSEMENQYKVILQDTGLDSFFSPFDQRVTLSTHLGILKPDCRIFQLALSRLGRGTLPLEKCLLITEEAFHVSFVRSFGMKALRFGAIGNPGVDFSSWAEVKSLIAQYV